MTPDKQGELLNDILNKHFSDALNEYFNIIEKTVPPDDANTLVVPLNISINIDKDTLLSTGDISSELKLEVMEVGLNVNNQNEQIISNDSN